MMYNKYVNLQKMLRGLGFVSIVCVAAITMLSGCIALPSPLQATPDKNALIPQEPPNVDITDTDITRPMDPPLDEWVNWTQGRDEQKAVAMQAAMNELSAITGIDKLERPNQRYVDQGYAAVAKFGDYCIAAITFSDTDDQLGIALLSRINFDAEVILMPTENFDKMKAFVSYYRGWCQGGEWPGAFDPTPFDPPESGDEA
jgi:hypothetical protein